LALRETSTMVCGLRGWSASSAGGWIVSSKDTLPTETAVGSPSGGGRMSSAFGASSQQQRLTAPV
jgi:hypothetical protein